jgi:uncharacterized protein (DUF433 family)
MGMSEDAGKAVALDPCYIFFMTSHIERITIDPDICNGKAVVRGLRITVETILDDLSSRS